MKSGFSESRRRKRAADVAGSVSVAAVSRRPRELDDVALDVVLERVGGDQVDGRGSTSARSKRLMDARFWRKTIQPRPKDPAQRTRRAGGLSHDINRPDEHFTMFDRPVNKEREPQQINAGRTPRTEPAATEHMKAFSHHRTRRSRRVRKSSLRSTPRRELPS